MNETIATMPPIVIPLKSGGLVDWGRRVSGICLFVSDLRPQKRLELIATGQVCAGRIIQGCKNGGERGSSYHAGFWMVDTHLMPHLVHQR